MKIILFTNSFPFGNAERSFLQHEVKHLSQAFDEVLIVPASRDGELLPLPNNVTVVDGQKYQPTMNWSYFFKMLQFANFWKSGKVRYFLSHTKNLVKRASQLEQALKPIVDKNTLFYTYWWEDWTTILGVLQPQFPTNKIVSRAHRFDLYDHENSFGFVPFRPMHLKCTATVFVISEDGKNYLQQRYPQLNVQVEKLGIQLSKEMAPIPENDAVFHVVSCSRVVDVKRVHFIAEALEYLDFPVKWTHFGDGALMSQLQQWKAKAQTHISVDLKENTPNDEVLHFYENQPVNVFVNASSSEGIPVSIMEAAGFGIPVIAGDVGGNREVVNATTGILLPRDFDPKAIATAIKELAQHTVDAHFRTGVKAYIEHHFSAEKNYNHFVQTLSTMNKNHQH